MITLRDGTTTEDQKLDRLRQFDERSRGFQVRQAMATAPRRRRRTVGPGPTLDQGSEGACVGFSSAHSVAALRIKFPSASAQWARALYRQAQRMDEWTGEDYEGTSVLAGMKALRAASLITEYRWCGAGSGDVIGDAIDSLRYVGPVVFGVPWLESMWEPRQDGVLEVDLSSKEVGGHAICGADALHLRLPGHKNRKLWIVLQNSWGTDWGTTYRGQGGFCYVDPEAWEALLERGGEGAVPIGGRYAEHG